MFIYSDKNRNICIDLHDTKRSGSPEYIISCNDNQGLLINGIPFKPFISSKLEMDKVMETAQVITEPTIIDLNNKNISLPEDTVGDGVFHIQAGGSLVIDGEGIINGVGKNDYNMAIWADGGNVTINNGTFTNEGAEGKDLSHFDLIYAKNGSVIEINGGTFICQTPRWTLNCHNTNPGTIIVKGGRFYKYNPAESYTDENGIESTNFVAPGYKVVQDGDWFIVNK